MQLDELNRALFNELGVHRAPDVTQPLEVLLYEVVDRVMASRTVKNEEEQDNLRRIAYRAVVHAAGEYVIDRQTPFAFLASTAKAAILSYQVRQKFSLWDRLKERK